MKLLQFKKKIKTNWDKVINRDTKLKIFTLNSTSQCHYYCHITMSLSHGTMST